ncbi:CoB--CoM heterodisulfide reductase iron-sulfur subunit A family protein, partial [Desulfovirgula thermocuniculi]|uniref:CoB--CoM heterodisulfide reductase iron-sulfur subunit A family protein n=1 Tax=Desulfovirgula thermocuniculi TaxID=348842 RepID=UPI0005516DE2
MLTTDQPRGSVVVVGAGISGMQSALDLAEAGFKVYVVERGPAVAGHMAMLDKTFPTNDCSMCILSPKVAALGGHHNIEVLTLAEVTGLSGEPGNFTVSVYKHPRFVDEKRCVSCGRCEQVCPREVASEFNQGLGVRKAIYKPYAQAYPNAYVVDPDLCIKCGTCVEKCARKAIDHGMRGEEMQIKAGAVILSPGFELFDAATRPELGYGRFPNVVTSLQFERILSASGPYQGHLVRPSDGKAPRRIAWIQCVGSREPRSGINYCSAVCCMYATKEAIVAKEHSPGLETTIFYMDMRAYGKGFEQYYRRAKDELGVRYVQCMISEIKEIPGSKNLLVRYRMPDGAFREEEFDMVVLSVGMRPARGTRELAAALGVELDEFGYCRHDPFNPVVTSRPGVFVGGTFAGPKDIPETVTEASAAAGYASRLLSAARGVEVRVKEYPPERPVGNEPPRVG